MYTSANMGLKVWNLLDDPFDHGQLEDNWAAVDTHNHSNGQGVQVPTGGLVDGSVTTNKLANAAVTDLNIAAATITGDKIVGGTITADKLSSSITTTLMPAGAILQWGGSVAPSTYLLCDGSAVSRAAFAALFGNIGTIWGSGDGSTTFNLPDLRQRFPLGKAASGTGSTLAAVGGAIDHTHTVSGLSVPGLGIPALTANSQSIPSLSVSANVPNHTHLNGGGAAISFSGFGGSTWIYANTAALQSGPTFLSAELFNFNGAATAAATGVSSVNLVGNTSSQNGTVTATGATSGGSTGGGTTQPDVTGGGTTGTGATGLQNPPYVVVNYIIKT